jgi:catechol 2,3-dioxygenase-like lactoylglutathione lyase family enzyme
MKIRHIGLVVLNIQVSLKFWTKYFGFRLFKTMNEKGETLDKMFGYKNLQIKSIKLKDKSGSILELIDIKKPPKKKVDNLTINNGITHFAITIKDLDGFYKKYKNKIEFNCAPQISKDTKVKVLYAKTPEKCYVELVEEL